MDNLRSSAVVLALLVGVPLSSATAQDDVAEAQSGDGQAEAAAELTPEAQREQAQAIEKRGEALAKRLQGLLNSARREGDIIKVTCLNDKLTQVNATLRTVSQRTDALEGALETGARDQARHEYTVLTVLAQKFKTLDQEANQCVGQDMYEAGAAQIAATMNPNLLATGVDPATAPEPALPPPSVTVPPPISPAM